MDTKPLERFATWARQELLTAVEAQATAVLKTDSVARTERAHAVRALEAEINRHGREHVIDKVAYMWFNRIIALRFMDARGYTDSGVVSPAQGQPHGQPEILADAKRGNIDTDVITSSRTAAAIMGLLDGTRRSTDPEGEAYALLLTAYCHYWHGSMPFMFEREDTYIELLVPANLLADGAILSRVVEVLTESVCNDVEVIGWLYQFYISERKDEVFAGFKKNKKAGADEIPAATQLFTPHWIVRYLVENSLGRLWMLNHPSSQLIDQMDYYVAPVDEEIDFLKVTKPEELTVIDPACGSGHMLTYAFDLLYSIYQEEGYAPSEIPSLILTHNLYGTEIDPRAGALAAFALAMKARARHRSFFINQVEPNICVIEPISFRPDELNFLVTGVGEHHEEVSFWNQFADANTLGSLIQADPDVRARMECHVKSLENPGDLMKTNVIDRAHRVVKHAAYLTPRYSVLVANPPYMDARNMSSVLYEYLVENFPDGFTGLDLAFALRANKLVRPKGYIGLLNMDSWLGNVECVAFRNVVRERLTPRIVLHLGARAFPEIKGEVVQVSASIFQRISLSQGRTTFIAATNGATFEEKIAQFHDQERRFLHQLDWFDVFPGRVFTAYAASENAHRAFATAAPMSSIAEVRTGLQTGDNGRFLRQWYEVSNQKIRRDSGNARWVPYVKSSSPTRWFAREDLVVDWSNDGADIRAHQSSVVRNSTYYFRPGLSYGGLAGNLKARFVTPGTIFDQKNSMIFPVGLMTTGQLLALINSAAFEYLARLISPKGFGVGTLTQLPIPEDVLKETRTEEISTRAIELTSAIFDRSEVSHGFVGLESIFLGDFEHSELRVNVEMAMKKEAEIKTEIFQLERENDNIFAAALLSIPPTTELGKESSPHQTSESTLIRDFVSYAIGCMFGRYSLDEPGLILADQGMTVQDYLMWVPNPTFAPDADNVIPIVDGDWFEDDIVERFRQFLRAAFGEEHFEENLRFVEESLGVKTLRDYFITKTGRSKFYEDHVQRYKKRPIYWMFSSPKGSFNALIYMHRYTPSTVSTVLNEYLREYRGKLEIALQNVDREAAGGRSSKAQKEADRIRKVLVELAEYEHDVLYPLAAQQVAIDLDDGVKVNYPKFGTALKKVKGLEAAE